MSADSPTERYQNARAAVVGAERRLAEAQDFAARCAQELAAVQPTKRKPESYWRERGFEFVYCGGCGHRYFAQGMLPIERARRSPSECEWCWNERHETNNVREKP